MIKSVDDVNAMLDSGSHPLQRLPAEDRSKFIEGLSFRNGRLVHADYSMLVNSLTHSEFYNLWSEFGISKAAFQADEDSACVGNACFPKPHSFCDSDECGGH